MFKKISNVSRTLIINTFEGFYYKDSNSINDVSKIISKSYDTRRLLTITKNIAKSIKVLVLNESTHSFNPFGDSASLLVEADLKDYNNGVLHLKESHISFHTYIEDVLENFLIIRLELHICSCAEENVFLSLPEIFSNQIDLSKKKDLLSPHFIIIDYLKRGSAFDSDSSSAPDKTHSLTNKISEKVFSNSYSCLRESKHSNSQQYILKMNEDLIKNCLQNSDKSIQDSSVSKFTKFLKQGYIDPHTTD